ncbi:MAG: 30S ribosomal protein S16 [Actinobacteria bacterium]|nr:30S ribosomal protein S16 [Actinomycetota bacterium]
MAAKIRLARMGKIRTPHFRIVVADSRSARNSKAIEEIGRYSPAQEPSLIIVNSERALYWMGVGATPTPAVEALLKITGDWQKFYDLPGKEGTLKVAPPRPDRRAAFEAAAKDAMNEPKEGATTLKKRAAEKLAAKSAPKAESTEPVAEAPVATTEESAPESAPASE